MLINNVSDQTLNQLLISEGHVEVKFFIKSFISKIGTDPRFLEVSEQSSPSLKSYILGKK